MATPTLTFNPITSVALISSYVVLDPLAVVTDGGNALGAIRLLINSTTSNLGILNGTTFSSSGTIGTIDYSFDINKRMLSLKDNTGGQTALGSDFQFVLRMVAFDRGSATGGSTHSISISLGSPLYLPATGRYYDFFGSPTLGSNAATAAAAKTFLGLTGYLANMTSAVKNAFLYTQFKGNDGWIGGNSAGTLNSVPRIWNWGGGPESGATFWTGDVDGTSGGQYTNWVSGSPSNGGYSNLTTNQAPYLSFSGTGTGLWYALKGDAGSSTYGFFVEYSNATGTGDDGLSGTRKTVLLTVDYDPVIIALLQSSSAVEVALINGVVTSAIGVSLGSITIGASNANHVQISIDLGTNNAGKRRQAQGFRIISGSERELIATRTRVGEVYNFVFLKTVDGSNSVKLVLN